MLASCRQCGDGYFPGNGGVPAGENGPVGATYPGRGSSGAGRRNPWRPQPQGTWLVIRYDAADVGIRPIPSGDVFWTSPDIWITGGDANGNPVGGQPCQIHARVWNLGTLPALPTSVSFSYIEPFLAIPITIPQPIATTGVLVPPMGYVVATVPWTPPPVAGNAHSCIIATCACAFSGDAPSLSGNVVADRHTAQRNLTIVAGTSQKWNTVSCDLYEVCPFALGRIEETQTQLLLGFAEERFAVHVVAKGVRLRDDIDRWAGKISWTSAPVAALVDDMIYEYVAS